MSWPDVAVQAAILPEAIKILCGKQIHRMDIFEGEKGEKCNE